MGGYRATPCKQARETDTAHGMYDDRDANEDASGDPFPTLTFI